jgi:L-ascorbate oxidase
MIIILLKKKISKDVSWQNNFIVTPELIKQMDQRGELNRNLYRPILKDTVAVPTQGYVITRFIADNPGVWMFHCHLDSHSDSGMMLMIRVGDTEDLLQSISTNN